MRHHRRPRVVRSDRLRVPHVPGGPGPGDRPAPGPEPDRHGPGGPGGGEPVRAAGDPAEDARRHHVQTQRGGAGPGGRPRPEDLRLRSRVPGQDAPRSRPGKRPVHLLEPDRRGGNPHPPTAGRLERPQSGTAGPACRIDGRTRSVRNPPRREDDRPDPARLGTGVRGGSRRPGLRGRGTRSPSGVWRRRTWRSSGDWKPCLSRWCPSWTASRWGAATSWP